jgi:hypothetical protein
MFVHMFALVEVVVALNVLTDGFNPSNFSTHSITIVYIVAILLAQHIVACIVVAMQRSPVGRLYQTPFLATARWTRSRGNGGRLAYAVRADVL